jgi:hypothetical protein
METEDERPDQEQDSFVSADDSFAGFVDTYEGEDEAINQSMIEGTRIKFTNEGTWADAQGVALDPLLALVAVEVKRVVNKWIDGRPAPESIVLMPGQKWPDIKKMNEVAPKSEWRIDPFTKQSKGPWEAQRLLYLMELTTLDKFTYPTNTKGGIRALHELSAKIAWAQKRCGAEVRPVVRPASTWMPTEFGGRQRPHFIIQKEWVMPDGTMRELLKSAPQITTVAAKLDAIAGKLPAPAPKPGEDNIPL